MFQAEKVLEKILSPGEKIKHQFSLGERFLKIKKMMALFIGFFILIGGGIIAIKIFEINIILVILIIICLLILLIGVSKLYFDWYLKISNIFILTDKRIIVHKGWLSTNYKSIDYKKITDIKIIESFFDRVIFKMGTLKINTAGTEGFDMILSCIENPYEIKRQIKEIKYSSQEKSQVQVDKKLI